MEKGTMMILLENQHEETHTLCISIVDRKEMKIYDIRKKKVLNSGLRRLEEIGSASAENKCTLLDAKVN